jgi:hypothetical protein
VLGREHDRVEARDLAVLVAERDLRLRVGPEPRQQATLAHFGLALDQAVREADRRRHQRVGLVARITEHETLVARTLLFGVRAVDAHRDVGRLLADDVEHAARAAVEPDVARRVADVGDDAADDLLEIDPRFRGDLAGHDGHARLDQRFDATRARLSWHSIASSTASEIWSATLSGCPSDTDSDVNT